jgi:hypothetical protein
MPLRSPTKDTTLSPWSCRSFWCPGLPWHSPDTTKPETILGPCFEELVRSFLGVFVGRAHSVKWIGAANTLLFSGELIQYATIFSVVNNDDIAAKEWRNEVAYRTLALLRCSVAVILYPTTKTPAWEIPELNGFEREDVQKNTFLNPATLRYAHEQRSEYEENLRVPIRLAYLLRKTIHSQEKRLGKPLHVVRELKVMGSLDGFMDGFYG